MCQVILELTIHKQGTLYWSLSQLQDKPLLLKNIFPSFTITMITLYLSLSKGTERWPDEWDKRLTN